MTKNDFKPKTNKHNLTFQLSIQFFVLLLSSWRHLHHCFNRLHSSCSLLWEWRQTRTNFHIFNCCWRFEFSVVLQHRINRCKVIDSNRFDQPLTTFLFFFFFLKKKKKTTKIKINVSNKKHRSLWTNLFFHLVVSTILNNILLLFFFTNLIDQNNQKKKNNNNIHEQQKQKYI